MDDICTYTIQLSGPVDEGEINTMSPLPMTFVRAGKTGSIFTVQADQSGLVGLIRFLHGLGLVFLSISRAEAECLSADVDEIAHNASRSA